MQNLRLTLTREEVLVIKAGTRRHFMRVPPQNAAELLLYQTMTHLQIRFAHKADMMKLKDQEKSLMTFSLTELIGIRQISYVGWDSFSMASLIAIHEYIDQYFANTIQSIKSQFQFTHQ